jgi:hypothetical protein
MSNTYFFPWGRAHTKATLNQKRFMNWAYFTDICSDWNDRDIAITITPVRYTMFISYATYLLSPSDSYSLLIVAAAVNSVILRIIQ